MLLSSQERRFLEAAARVTYSNPFSPELLDAEKAALGRDFKAEAPVWSLDIQEPLRPRANSWLLAERLEALTADLRRRMHEGKHANESELRLYEDACLLTLYYRFYHPMSEAAFAPASRQRWAFYRDFLAAWQVCFAIEQKLPSGHRAAHTFALFVQIVRAFRTLFENILGSSQPAGRLREAVWRSIFTHDLRRYGAALYNRMGEFATLITGPSGTGKEVVARTIATARYQPFDEHRLAFPVEAESLFWPINIAALSPTLVESELFGHRRGAFTGAMGDRKGYLESCPELGGVFLDELGEMSLEVQVKLLRVIESRQFTPVGDTQPKRFQGKLLAATNRDLAGAIQEGKFREDLYYRLCSDLIQTPSLAQQIRENPGVLRDLVAFMARKNGGDEKFTDLALTYVEKALKHHTWPGNYRELEQCVRNLLIRGEYTPAAPIGAGPDWVSRLTNADLSADELLNHYCRLAYEKLGTYEGAAERIGLDRRTVRARMQGVH